MSTKQVAMEEVMATLKTCYDPEIPVNIVDLGLVYDVKVAGENVYVKMTLTGRGCPAHSAISKNVQDKVNKIEGVKSTNVEIVWDPPWSPEMMSEEAKKKLGYGPKTPPANVTEDMKPTKIGRPYYPGDGRTLLVNPKEEAYEVSKDELEFWLMCEGSKAVNELVDDLAKKYNMTAGEVKPQLMQVVADMVEAGLLS